MMQAYNLLWLVTDAAVSAEPEEKAAVHVAHQRGLAGAAQTLSHHFGGAAAHLPSLAG